MSTTKRLNSPLCFTPLNPVSQGATTPVLYYDNHAPLDSLFECATTRLSAASNLLEAFFDFKQAPSDTLPMICIAASLLINDALVILEEFNPVALQLRAEGCHNQ